jgi:hypothetical protein
MTPAGLLPMGHEMGKRGVMTPAGLVPLGPELGKQGVMTPAGLIPLGPEMGKQGVMTPAGLIPLGPEMGKQGVMTPAGLVPSYSQPPYSQQPDGRIYLPALYPQEGSSSSYMDQNYGPNNENIPGTSLMIFYNFNTRSILIKLCVVLYCFILFCLLKFTKLFLNN